MSEDWSQAEVALAVSDYLDMLTLELQDEGYLKADHWRALMPHLRNRSKGSIEFKYGNVSAALRDLGYPFVDGYKPYANYQAIVGDGRQPGDNMIKSAWPWASAFTMAEGTDGRSVLDLTAREAHKDYAARRHCVFLLISA